MGWRRWPSSAGRLPDLGRLGGRSTWSGVWGSGASYGAGRFEGRRASPTKGRGAALPGIFVGFGGSAPWVA